MKFQILLSLLLIASFTNALTFVQKVGGQKQKCSSLEGLPEEQIVYVPVKVSDLAGKCDCEKPTTGTPTTKPFVPTTSAPTTQPSSQFKWGEWKCVNKKYNSLCERQHCCRSRLQENDGEWEKVGTPECKWNGNLQCKQDETWTKPTCHWKVTNSHCQRLHCCKYLRRNNGKTVHTVKTHCEYQGEQKCRTDTTWGSWTCNWKNVNRLCTREHCCRHKLLNRGNGWQNAGHQECQWRGGNRCRTEQRWTQPTCSWKNTNSHCTRMHCCKHLQQDNGNGFNNIQQQCYWTGNENCRTEWNNFGQTCSEQHVGNHCYQTKCCTRRHFNQGRGWQFHSNECRNHGGQKCRLVCQQTRTRCPWGRGTRPCIIHDCFQGGRHVSRRPQFYDVHFQTLKKNWTHFRYVGAFKYLYYKDVKTQVVAKSFGEDSAFTKFALKKGSGSDAILVKVGYNKDNKFFLTWKGKKVEVGGAHKLNGVYVERLAEYEAIVKTDDVTISFVGDGKVGALTMQAFTLLKDTQVSGILKNGFDEKYIIDGKTLFGKSYVFEEKSGKFKGTPEEVVAAKKKAKSECGVVQSLRLRRFCVSDNMVSGLDWSHAYLRYEKDSKKLENFKEKESAKHD